MTGTLSKLWNGSKYNWDSLSFIQSIVYCFADFKRFFIDKLNRSMNTNRDKPVYSGFTKDKNRGILTGEPIQTTKSDILFMLKQKAKIQYCMQQLPNYINS